MFISWFYNSMSYNTVMFILLLFKYVKKVKIVLLYTNYNHAFSFFLTISSVTDKRITRVDSITMWHYQLPELPRQGLSDRDNREMSGEQRTLLDVNWFARQSTLFDMQPSSHVHSTFVRLSFTIILQCK